jgi:SLT domain-containing protein
MPSWAVVPIHNHHAAVGLVKQRIGKSHADSAAADD